MTNGGRAYRTNYYYEKHEASSRGAREFEAWVVQQLSRFIAYHHCTY